MKEVNNNIKGADHNKEINRTEPSHLTSVPCYVWPILWLGPWDGIHKIFNVKITVIIKLGLLSYKELTREIHVNVVIRHTYLNFDQTRFIRNFVKNSLTLGPTNKYQSTFFTNKTTQAYSARASVTMKIGLTLTIVIWG